jgi:flavin reductase (DIM6/NTAB) family NADH-FMN oxidoreductase RutF
MKEALEPYVALIPCPVVLVTVVGKSGQSNIITLAWAANLCSEPPIVGISVRPSRFSYHLLREVPEFVVNIPNIGLKRQVEWCGANSGRGFDKFAATDLTPEPASLVQPSLIGECPLNLECRVRQIIPLGSHDLFLGEVLRVHLDQECLTSDGKLDPFKLKPLAFVPGDRYYGLQELPVLSSQLPPSG